MTLVLTSILLRNSDRNSILNKYRAWNYPILFTNDKISMVHCNRSVYSEKQHNDTLSQRNREQPAAVPGILAGSHGEDRNTRVSCTNCHPQLICPCSMLSCMSPLGRTFIYSMQDTAVTRQIVFMIRKHGTEKVCTLQLDFFILIFFFTSECILVCVYTMLYQCNDPHSTHRPHLIQQSSK